MIDFTAQITTKDADRPMVIETLRQLTGPTRVLPGCVGCELLVDVDLPNRITFIERWQDEESLVRHIGSREFRSVLAVVDLSTVEPTIRFGWIARTEDLEFVREAFENRSTGEKP